MTQISKRNLEAALATGAQQTGTSMETENRPTSALSSHNIGLAFLDLPVREDDLPVPERIEIARIPDFIDYS